MSGAELPEHFKGAWPDLGVQLTSGEMEPCAAFLPKTCAVRQVVDAVEELLQG